MELDPRAIEFCLITGCTKTCDHPSLPLAVRELKYVINKERLFPGDLILMRPIAGPEKFSRLTRHVQRNQFPTNNEWTHAAIYYHDWIVIDATPESDVSTNNLLITMTSHVFMVRRGRYVNDEIVAGRIEAARNIGLSIVLEAALLQGKARYGLISAVSIFLRSKGIKWSLPNETSIMSIVCSGLYVKCYHIATGKNLLSASMQRDEEAVTPALLANISGMITINAGWSGLVD